MTCRVVGASCAGDTSMPSCAPTGRHFVHVTLVAGSYQASTPCSTRAPHVVQFPAYLNGISFKATSAL